MENSRYNVQFKDKYSESDLKNLDFYSIKTGTSKTVQSITDKENPVEILRLNRFRDDLSVGQIVFIVFGGDKGKPHVTWETGFIGIGRIAKAPYGFENRNFKLQINIEILLEKNIKKSDLVPYKITYNIPGISPMTKGEPNQALSHVRGNQAVGLVRAVLDKYPDLQDPLTDLFGPRFMHSVRDKFTYLIEKDQSFEEIQNQSNSIIKEKNGEYIVAEKPERDPKEDGLAHNRIIFGPPGTGKSFKLEEERKTYFGSCYDRVTFHPNYSYGQFVGTYKPKPEAKDSNVITYKLVPGPFLRMLVKALQDNKNYLLVIEEINRANTSAVFGDIFQLLDRDNDGKSEYSITVSEEIKEYIKSEGVKVPDNKLYLPSNFYIWSTMNTADQGVYPIDSAFKRRFDFNYIGINENEEEISSANIHVNGIGLVNWNEFRKALNTFLMDNLRNMKEDKLIGPFFIKKKIIEGTKDLFQNVFKNKLLMYLAEDVVKTNKTLLFKYPSFSMIMQEYDKNEDSVFSEKLTRELEQILIDGE